MPVTINRILADAAQNSTIEFVTSGAAGGEVGTIIDVGTLTGADGSGDERVRIVKLTASVSVPNGSGSGGVSLFWGGSGDLFCTLSHGVTTLTIPFEPTAAFDGTITYDADNSVNMTLRIGLEKLHGFPNSMAKFASGI